MSRSIDGRSDGRRIVLPIRILQATPSTEVFGIEMIALLDTGSTTSGITPRRAQQLGLPKRGKKPIGSAQGEGQAERYLFRVGLQPSVGTSPLPYVFSDVIGFELADSFSLDALIGMDILSQCDFTMDRAGRWSLAFG
jgi:hypothetical protein